MSGKAFSDMRPQIVQSFFVLATQRAFAEHSMYPWNENRGTSKILIQSSMAEDAKESGIHPAIIIDSGNLNFNNDSIGNRSSVARYKEYLIKEVLTYTVSGSITFTCRCESKIASENLAYELSSFLVITRNSIGKVLQLQQLSMPQQSKAIPVIISGGHTLYEAHVQVGYNYVASTVVTPVDFGPLLADVISSISPNSPIPGAGGVGGTYTGGETGNWGGTGEPGGGDAIDDGRAAIGFSAKT